MKRGKYFILSFIILAIIIVLGYYRYFRIELISDTVVAELGEPFSTDVSEYAKGNITHAKLDVSEVNIQKAGLYEAYITNGSRNLKLSFKVKDTTPPTANAIENLKFLTHEDVNASTLVTDVKDRGNSITIFFEDDKENHTYTEGGEVQEKIVLTDDSGNKNYINVTFKIIADTAKPTIKGVKSIVVYTGDVVDYLKGISAEDDRDGNLTSEIKVDSEKVDLTTPGKYIIQYSVSDRSGNVTKKKTSITVMEDKAPVLKGLTDKTIYVNDKINYLVGVTAEDDRDGNITSRINVNSTKVDVTRAGVYEAVYTITDSTGNKTLKTITVTVHKKTSTPSVDKKSTEKSSSKSNKDTKSDSSGGFEFFDVPPSGPDVNGDVPAGGKQDVGTWG